jgi:hypothetical protein
MMENLKLHSLLPLQLFAEAAAGDTGVTAPDAGVQGVKQEASADTAQLPETTDADAAFEQLIRGPYKDQYNARVQQIVRKRLKDRTAEADEPAQAKASEEQIQAYRHEQVRRQCDQWLAQEQQARELYPSLELGKELQSPRFRELLRSGVAVEDAYFLVHRDEILPAVMHYSAETARQKLANRIAANDVRPSENAMAGSAAGVVRQDVRHMTKAQRQDIIRRVQKGEIIRF